MATSNFRVKGKKFQAGWYTLENFGYNLIFTKAFAKQNPDGTQSPLTSEDIDLCKSIGFKYVLPDNIVSNENDDDEDEDMEDDDLDIDEDIDDEDMDD